MGEKTIIRRRALLTGGVGAIVGTAVTGLKNPSTAQAESSPVLLGEENHATGVTAIVNDDAHTDYGNTLRVTSHATALEVYSESPSQPAIWVTAVGEAIRAESRGKALYAYSSEDTAVFGWTVRPSGTAIYGYGALPASRGVHGYGSVEGVKGESNGEIGYGVRGIVWRGGAGVYGQSDHKGATGVLGSSMSPKGFAIRGDGRIKFDKVSGQAKITAGQTAVTITPGVNIHSGSFMLLTPKADIGSRGLWFTTNPTTDTVTIHISSPRTVATTIAWLLLG